jgi:hypothetical protein
LLFGRRALSGIFRPASGRLLRTDGLDLESLDMKSDKKGDISIVRSIL